HAHAVDRALEGDGVAGAGVPARRDREARRSEAGRFRAGRRRRCHRHSGAARARGAGRGRAPDRDREADPRGAARRPHPRAGARQVRARLRHAVSEHRNASIEPLEPAPLRIAVAGLGAVGRVVARRLDAGMPGARLAAVAVRDRAKAASFLAELATPVEVLALAELPQAADVIVEALPAAALDRLAEPALRAGRTLVLISVGVLLERPQWVELARRHGGRIVVPTGALLGLDAVKAAAEGTVHSVRMVTRKPPGGLAGAPYLLERGISLEGLKAPLKLYEGPAREA